MRKRLLKKPTSLVIGVAVGMTLTILGVWGLFDYVTRTQDGPTTPDTERIIVTDDAPSEKKVVVGDEYNVPDDQPRRIKIDVIGVEAYIQKMGVTKDNSMATPRNIYFAGWYMGSPAPGEKGVSIINGHVSGRYNDGVFKHLDKLKSSNIVRVEMGNGTWRNFEVVSTNTYPLEQTTDPLYDATPGLESELHLITCSGAYNKSTQTYADRTVVVAKRI